MKKNLFIGGLIVVVSLTTYTLFDSYQSEDIQGNLRSGTNNAIEKNQESDTSELQEPKIEVKSFTMEGQTITVTSTQESQTAVNTAGESFACKAHISGAACAELACISKFCLQ